MKYKIVYETKYYTIKKIPLNYRIDIKPTLILKDKTTGIERDWYSDIEQPLERAIQIAEDACEDHFRLVTKEEAKYNQERAFKMRFHKRNT